MKSKEIDEMLHRIREELEKEREGLTVAERLEREQRVFAEMQKNFHLPIYPKPSWAKSKGRRG